MDMNIEMFTHEMADSVTKLILPRVWLSYQICYLQLTAMEEGSALLPIY
jgi:hypothetical protein